MVDKWLSEFYKAYSDAPKVPLTPDNSIHILFYHYIGPILESIMKYIQFCNDLKQRETTAVKARQAEHLYFTQKIKTQLQYAKLLPESLSLPARQDLGEIAAIYQALGTLPETILTDDSMQLSLLSLINQHYSNQHLLMERKKMLHKTKEMIDEEKSVESKFVKTHHTLDQDKIKLDSATETLNNEIKEVLGPRQKDYEYKEYVAKVIS